MPYGAMSAARQCAGEQVDSSAMRAGPAAPGLFVVGMSSPHTVLVRAGAATDGRGYLAPLAVAGTGYPRTDADHPIASHDLGLSGDRLLRAVLVL